MIEYPAHQGCKGECEYAPTIRALNIETVTLRAAIDVANGRGADTRVLLASQLQAISLALSKITGRDMADELALDGLAAEVRSIRTIIGTATPAPSDKIAEAAQDKTAAELVIDAYDAANPFRQADMHPALCHCNRCAIDWLRALAGKGE